MAKKTLVYQIYLFGFLEQDGLSAISAATRHLDRVQALGVTHVWVGPVFASPWCDHGYDVSDYYQIDPRFGTMQEFDDFVFRAHELGLEALIDLIPNHTSTQHEWFQDPQLRRKFYCWARENRPGWHNLFNGGSAWQYHEETGLYYCHLFQETQADLDWFPRGVDKGVNQELVQQFHRIIDFWLQDHGVDGFRLDIPQGINKELTWSEPELTDFLFGDRAAQVLNALFGGVDCTLIMECLDPTMGELVEYYLSNTPVDFVFNMALKDQITQGELKFLSLIERQAKIPGFMLELESHDAPRFPGREISYEDGQIRRVTPEDAIWYMFRSSAQAICLYQGQELGLANPTREELPDHRLVSLDAQTAMRFRAGELLQDLRPTSRANARIPLPLEEYARQEQTPSSYLALTKDWIHRWFEA